MSENKFNDKLAEQAKNRRKRLLAQKTSGYTASEIAAMNGISRQRVSQLLKLAKAD